MEEIFGIMTLIFSLGATFIGLPKQISKNYREGKCGIDFWLILFPFGVFLSRFIYAFLIKSWYIAIPDCFGILISLVIVAQFFGFFLKKNKTES